MTAKKKTGIAGGLTLAGIIGVLALWPSIKPWLEWVAPIFGREAVQHVAIGWLAGAFTLPLPWVMPPSLAPVWTRTVAAAIAATVAVTTCILLFWPLTRTEFVYAVFMAGMGTITINGAVTGLYLHLRPSAVPESLQP